jgi:predicted RNA-binding Zn-ribbon protein involved in translation (DUF1610 family)
METDDLVQTIFDRADITRYQCSKCRFEYTRSRMVRKSAPLGLDGLEYFCPNCGALVVRIVGCYGSDLTSDLLD